MKKNPFLRLILRESTFSLPKLALLTAVAGLANVVVFTVVSRVAQLISRETGGAKSGEAEASLGTLGKTEESDWLSGIDDWLSGVGQASSGVGEASSGGISDFLVFLAVILVFLVSQRYAMLTTCWAVEDAVQRIRVRIARKITACELLAFEKIGRGAIFSCLSRDTEVLSEMAIHVVYGFQMGVMVIFTGIYLAFVSPVAFWLVVAFIFSAGFVIIKQHKTMNDTMTAAALSGNLLLEAMTHLLDGFKEIKLNNQRRDHVLREVDSVSLDARESKMSVRKTMADYMIFTQSSFYVLLLVILFVVPKFALSFGEDAVQVSTAILFMMGPILGVTSSVSLVETVTRAAVSIERMEQTLDNNASLSTERAEDARLVLESLRLYDLKFDYLDDEGATLFSMGPLGLEVPAGTTVFFIGGNGSGKSTLLKLLTSLYEPRSGSLFFNRIPVLTENRQSFREQIGAVFSDYHLFNRLYGLEDVDDAKANEMIDDLGLGGKTKVVSGEFETLELSAGQRKRLGLLVTLLEDRPILVLDEVAADQDPEFRQRFYEDLLPKFQRAGKTLLLASHDDRYFHTADLLVVLDEGKIREIKKPRKET